MNIIDEIKLALWLKGLWAKLNAGGSNMGGMLKKLDGYKSILGLMVVVAYYIVPQYTKIVVPPVVLKLGLGMASAGLAHKLEKATGVIGIVLDGVKAALAAITAKESK